jgi:hypothetical protein
LTQSGLNADTARRAPGTGVAERLHVGERQGLGRNRRAVFRFTTDLAGRQRWPVGPGGEPRDPRGVRVRALIKFVDDEHSCATNGVTVVTDVYELEAYHVRS